MRRAVFSSYKPGFSVWPQGASALYPSGLISALFFNEGGGTGVSTGDAVLWDSVQNEVINLESAGDMATAAWVQGNGGVALNFPSGNFLAGTNYTRALDPQTFVMWMKPGTTGCPIAKNDANTVSAGWAVATTSTLLEFLVEFSSTNMIRTFTGPANWSSAWHHVAIVTDNTTTAANSFCYIDGILAAVNSSQNGSGSHGSDETFKYRIGRTTGSFSGFASGNWADGSLESVLLFNRQLSASEIQALYAQSYRWYHRIVNAISTSQQFTKTLTASMATFAGSLTAQRTSGKTFDASMSTFAATLSKQTSKTLSASMSTFDGAIAKFISVARATFNAAMSTFDAVLTSGKIKAGTINAAMLQFAGRITRQIGKVLTAGMSTFSATLTPQFIKGDNLVTVTAGMSTFDGALTFQSSKSFSASMVLFSATLSLSVTHGGVPPTCIPAACDTITPIISHVEQCELEGS